MSRVATVTTNNLNMRAEPNATSEIKGTLKRGDRITIFESKDGWAKSYGYWVSETYLKYDGEVVDKPVVNKKAEYISTTKLHIVKVPKDCINKFDFVNIKGGMYVSNFKSTYGADILINGCLFDMNKGLNYVDCEDSNVRSGYLGADIGIGIKNGKDVLWCTGDEARKDSSIVDWIGGAPTLVISGKVNLQWGDYYDAYINGNHQRSCVGFDKDGTIYFICTKSNMRLSDLATELVKIGLTHAINLDGGGSSTLWFKGSKYKTSGRKIASWLMIKLK